MTCEVTDLNRRVHSDRKSGMTYQEIARKYGFSASRARQHYKRVEWILDVESRRRPTPNTRDAPST